MPNFNRFSFSLALAAFLYPQYVLAQSTTLPATSRTVFKCMVNGKVVYTDEPCVGATRVNVEPTRGMNKNTGKELTGQDVSREKQREQFAEAIKPLTGLTPRQLEVERNRVYLSSEAKSECAGLDRGITQKELQERPEPIEAKAAVQRELFALRKRYRELRC